MTQTIINVPAAGAFDPTDIEITDNTSGAFLIKEGSNEYMRIDTTNTQEKTIFKTQSGANTGFFVEAPTVGNVLSITRGGSPATRTVLNAGTTLFQVDSNQILADLISDVKTFKVDGTNVSPLVITGDTNATFTLDSGNSAVFKVQDDAGSPHEYMKIDTTSGQPGVTIKMPTGVPLRFQADQYQGLNASGSVYRAFSIGSANNWAFGDMTSASPGYLRGYANDIQIIHAATSGSNSGVKMRARGAGTGDTFKIQSDTEANFEVDQNSNATFTLDSGNSAVFNVQDDAGTPHEYIKVDTTSGSEAITMKGRPGLTSQLVLNNDPFLQGSSNQSVQMASFGVNIAVSSLGNRIINKLGTSTNYFQVSDSANAAILKIEEDSNATFTLDDTSGAVFKIVDDGSSPYTYLSATEGENCVRMQSLRTDSSGLLQLQNNAGTPILQIYQNSYLQRFVQPRDSKTRTGLTGSGASQSTTIDFRLGSVKGVQHLQINHGYSGTQTVTLNFNNTLSGFAGNQDWGVNSLLVLVENLTTGQDVTFQIRETTGGTTTFIDHTGASLSDPTGSGSLTLKNAGAASGKNFITFRVTQFNNSHGSASIFDDDRYIVEALTAELY